MYFTINTILQNCDNIFKNLLVKIIILLMLLIWSQEGKILGWAVQPWSCGEVFPSQGKPFIIQSLAVVYQCEHFMHLDIPK